MTTNPTSPTTPATPTTTTTDPAPSPPDTPTASDASNPTARILGTLRDLFTSKKFLAALTAGLILLAGWVARAAGADVDQGTLDRVLIALLTYVGAQGLSDVGKSAAQARIAATTAASLAATLGELFTSKKFLATLAAGLVAWVAPIAQHLGLRVDQDTLDRAFLALLAYVGAQGLSDFGKGAAQVSATVREARPTPPPA